jgi:hypothetical protein
MSYTRYLIINILYIATFLYKNESTKLRTQIMKIYFNFFNIRRFQV